MPDNDRPFDLEFPLGGLNVMGEFQEQPAGTTPTATNVRGLNPDSRRARGGSRAGLFRYIPGPLFDGADLIQHLNVIVDPSGDALQQNFEVPNDDWVEDPLNPGTFVPPGGWGYSGGATQPVSEITYIQGKRQKFDADTIQQSVAFPSAVTNNNTIVVFVATGADVSGVHVTVENNTSPTGWAQVGSYIEITNPVGGTGSVQALSCWKKTANSGSNDNTVKVQPGNSAEMAIVILEYAGMPTAGQVDTAVTNSDDTLSPPAPATTGNVAVLGSHEMVLGAFSTNFDPSAFTPGSGFTCRPSSDDGVDSGPVPEFRLNVVEKTGLAFPGNNPTVATGTTSGGEDPYTAIGVSWKKS